MSFFRLTLSVVLIVVTGLSVAYAVVDPLAQACDAARANGLTKVCPRYSELVLASTLILAAVVTLFGTMAIPGGQDEEGSFREQRIRFSITMSILVLYLTYFSVAVFWAQGKNEMVDTLTSLLMVVIPFYFGASAATQWGQKRHVETSAHPSSAA